MRRTLAIVLLCMPVAGLKAESMVTSHFNAKKWKDVPATDCAAHNKLPFGTKLRLTYNGKNTIVVICGRGPFIRGRHLDISNTAAKRLGFFQKEGVVRVKVERLGKIARD